MQPSTNLGMVLTDCGIVLPSNGARGTSRTSEGRREQPERTGGNMETTQASAHEVPLTEAGGDTEEQAPGLLSKVASGSKSTGGYVVKHGAAPIARGIVQGFGVAVGALSAVWLANRYGINPLK